MDIFYINTVIDSNGKYKLHKAGCPELPKIDNIRFIGIYNNYKEASGAAKKNFTDITGCEICCNGQPE